MTEQQQNTLNDITYTLADRYYIIKRFNKERMAINQLDTIRMLFNTLEEAHGLIDELKEEG